MSASLALLPPAAAAADEHPFAARDRIKQQIVARAAELGFDSCRVAPAEKPRTAAAFRNWLNDGAAGTMEWLHRGEEKRSNP